MQLDRQVNLKVAAFRQKFLNKNVVGVHKRSSAPVGVGFTRSPVVASVLREVGAGGALEVHFLCLSDV